MIWWIALLLAGCGMHDPIIHRLLEQGDGIPPRARMYSLDSVDDLEWLSMECQCNYFYLRVKARYDLGQVHAADTLLIAQAAYFERRGEPAKAAYLSLAAGRAFREIGVNEEAFRCISEAESLVWARQTSSSEKWLPLPVLIRNCKTIWRPGVMP